MGFEKEGGEKVYTRASGFDDYYVRPTEIGMQEENQIWRSGK